jgi:hypothetical protein
MKVCNFNNKKYGKYIEYCYYVKTVVNYFNGLKFGILYKFFNNELLKIEYYFYNNKYYKCISYYDIYTEIYYFKNGRRINN